VKNVADHKRQLVTDCSLKLGNVFVMVNYSTNINKKNNHLSTQTIQYKRQRRFALKHLGHA